MRRLSCILLALAIVGSWALTPAQAGKDEGILIDLHRSGARKVRVSMAPLSVQSSDSLMEARSRSLASRLVRDFVYSGVIAVVGDLPQGVVLPRDVPNEVEGDDHRPDAVVALSLSGEDPGHMSLTARLLAPGQQNLILGKRYVVDVEQPGPAVHHFCDTVVRQLTGDEGIARTRILFSRGNERRREIHIVDYDGENLKRITRNGSINLAPRWSPDQQTVCYTSYFRGRQRLLLLDGKTGRSKRIAQYEGLNVGANWSPDGSELVTTLSKDGNAEIYRLRRDGSIVQRLTHAPSIECSPDFDPTGHQIVFTSDRTGLPQLYVMDREGSNRRRLTYEGRYNESAAWSPKGDRIAYVSRVDGRFQVFIIEPDGSNLRQITFAKDGNNEDPSWAPDGRHLVVSSDRSGQSQLWVIDVESLVARRLTSGGASDTNPDWSGVKRGSATSGEPQS